MYKKHYTVPETEWLEAENASCFLEESPGASIPDLGYDDTEIKW